MALMKYQDYREHRIAYRGAVKAIEQDRIDTLKKMIREALDKLTAAERDKQKAEETIAAIRRDLDDMKRGRLDKIKARREKEKAAGVSTPSPITLPSMEKLYQTALLGQTYTTNATNLHDIGHQAALAYNQAYGQASGSQFGQTSGAA